MPFRSLVYLTSLSFFFATAAVFADNKPTESKKGGKPDRAALEKEFSKKLSGAALVGRFSIVGRNNEKPARSERYELDSVTKLEGRDDYWVFVARIKYGETNLKVPLTLKVLWAGDTPMISITDFTIPGLGTFTARVMFYGDRYAGTWQHGKAGGHMWGQIETMNKDENSPSKK